MIKIAIVDDENYYQEILRQSLCEQLELIFHIEADIQCFSNAEDFLNAWHQEHFHLIFFDIYLDSTDPTSMNGIEIAQKVRDEDADVKIVFCSTSNEFGPESYRVNASYYLQKPLSAKSLSDALNRVDLSSLISAPTLTLPNGVSLTSNEISYTIFSNHIFTLYLRNGTSYPYPSGSVTQKEMTQRLQALSSNFIPIDRSTIVNLDSVVGINDTQVIVSPASHVPLIISRAKKKEIRSIYLKYKLKKISH